MQYVRAMNELNPDYFLYENNYMISPNIRDKISSELGVVPVMINSALVSAQHRRRYYWTNISNISVPEDKHILFRDVLEPSRVWKPCSNWVYSWYGNARKIDKLKLLSSDKSNALTTKNTHCWQYYLNDDKSMYTNLTPVEYERLQTLPDNYTEGVSNGARFKAIGNGWTVDVIAHIFKGLL